MRHECWVLGEFSMYSGKMQRSLSWFLWVPCDLYCCESCADVYLWSWVHRWPLLWMFIYSLWVIFQSNSILNYNEKQLAYWNTFEILAIEPQPQSLCSRSPCGANAICKERNGVGSCSCLPDYYGDPYIECRPECVLNSDCTKDKACINNKCKDPCPGVCGMNAECRVNNHAPSCACLPGYEGNPFSSCYISKTFN